MDDAATLTGKGQATIPKSIREYLGVESGDQIKFFRHPDGTVRILPKRPASAIRGILKSRRGPVSIEEMNEAIAAGAAEAGRPRRRR